MPEENSASLTSLLSMVDAERHELIDRVDLDGKSVGPTDYIDRIDHKLFQKNIIYGKDHYNRAYIACRYTEINQNPSEQSTPEQKVKIMSVFQRYTDLENYFVSGGQQINGSVQNFKIGGLIPDDILRFFELINRGTVNYSYELFGEQHSYQLNIS